MANLNYDEKIKSWIEKNQKRVIDEWIEISRIPAIKGAAEDGAPFGKDCAKALEKCTQLFREHGFETELFSEKGYSLASYGNGEKTIGLFGHSDVVPAGDDWIYTKPFEPIAVDGTLIGRGVEDNKSGIMASLCAMEIIRDCDIPMKNKIQAFIGSEEETGMSDIRSYASEQPMPAASLVLDADFPCSIGEKGIYHFMAYCQNSFDDIVKFEGGEAFNVVLDKATVSLRKSDELKKELLTKTHDDAKFSLFEDGNFIKVQAKGVAKHACEPEGSVNAAYLIAELLSETKAISENDRKIMADVKEILSCPFGTSMGIAHDDIRFGKLTFVNGMANVRDGKLGLSFDTRYGSTLDGGELEKMIEESFGTFGWTIEKKSHSEGFSIADDSPIPDALVEVYNKVTGFDKKAIRLGGGTYARLLKNAFSVGTWTDRKDRTTPFMEMPEGHGGVHQCDEKIDIEAFFDAVRIITHYIINIDECI